MIITIEIADELDAALQAKAIEIGVSTAGFARQVLEQALHEAGTMAAGQQPFETGYGMWAKYGTAPSAQEIDENRRDMFRNLEKELG